MRELSTSEEALICSVNLGEVLYALTRSHGRETALDRVDAVRRVLRVADPDWELVRAAALVKAAGGMSYADAFCIATAREQAAPVATGDPEILSLADLVETIDLRVGPAK